MKNIEYRFKGALLYQLDQTTTRSDYYQLNKIKFNSIQFNAILFV